MSRRTQPAPSGPTLIGPAALAVQILLVKAARLEASGQALKALLYGPFGTGKTCAAEAVAAQLTSEPLNIQRVNGKEITLDFVRDFKARVGFSSVFPGRLVLIANECDAMTADAKDLFLSVLDELPPHWAFIGTTNADLVTDSKIRNGRFQSRLHCIEVGAPRPADIAAHILTLMPSVPPAIAAQIAEICDGCVRSAILDAENYLDVQQAQALAA